jgi:hypothetical protein
VRTLLWVNKRLFALRTLIGPLSRVCSELPGPGAALRKRFGILDILKWSQLGVPEHGYIPVCFGKGKKHFWGRKMFRAGKVG